MSLGIDPTKRDRLTGELEKLLEFPEVRANLEREFEQFMNRHAVENSRPTPPIGPRIIFDEREEVLDL